MIFNELYFLIKAFPVAKVVDQAKRIFFGGPTTLFMLFILSMSKNLLRENDRQFYFFFYDDMTIDNGIAPYKTKQFDYDQSLIY